MGFTTGFTGGVTVVLGAAYLTLQAHQRNRQAQAEALRAQTYTLHSLSYVPASAPPPRTVAEELALLEHQQELLARAEQHRRRRWGAGGDDAAGFVGRAKDRWNAEVEGAVRWAANKDWVAAREDAEDAAARVWARLTGGEPPAARPVRAAAAKAEEAAGSIWERGLRKGKEVAGKAKAAVGAAEDRAERAAAGLAASVSDVEKVLQQRYERRHEEVLGRKVEDILADRYKPVEQLDNSRLRGV